MMRRALVAVDKLDVLGDDHLYALDGMDCASVVVLLEPAIDWWQEAEGETSEIMADLEPRNGWGSASTAFEFWHWVLSQCRKFPNGRLSLHG